MKAMNRKTKEKIIYVTLCILKILGLPFLFLYEIFLKEK